MAREASAEERIIAYLGDCEPKRGSDLVERFGPWRTKLSLETLDLLEECEDEPIAEGSTAVWKMWRLRQLPPGYKWDPVELLLYRVISPGRILEIQKDGSVQVSRK